MMTRSVSLARLAIAVLGLSSALTAGALIAAELYAVTVQGPAIRRACEL